MEEAVDAAALGQQRCLKVNGISPSQVALFKLHMGRYFIEHALELRPVVERTDTLVIGLALALMAIGRRRLDAHAGAGRTRPLSLLALDELFQHVTHVRYVLFVDAAIQR